MKSGFDPEARVKSSAILEISVNKGNSIECIENLKMKDLSFIFDHLTLRHLYLYCLQVMEKKWTWSWWKPNSDFYLTSGPFLVWRRSYYWNREHDPGTYLSTKLKFYLNSIIIMTPTSTLILKSIRFQIAISGSESQAFGVILITTPDFRSQLILTSRR